MGHTQERALADRPVRHPGGFAVQLGLGQNDERRAETFGGPQRHLAAKGFPVPRKHRRPQLPHDLIRRASGGRQTHGQQEAL